jgi:formate hydrogenlyase subunit 3/multisubunit Na+/H+ antiporter MnhD subunit
MSAPIVWIILPILAGGGVLAFHRYTTWSNKTAGYFSLFLSLLAWIIPISEPIQLGPLRIELAGVLNLFGRQFILETGDGILLGLVFGMAAVWFWSATTAKAPRLFAGSGLISLGLLVAALAVEPFLYSALIIEIAVLITTLMLVSPGKQVSQGVMRYLIYQTLAIPFILYAGWLLDTIGINPSDSAVLLQAILFLGLGLAFWLAIFPFYSWVPSLSEETNPYAAGFIFSFFPMIVFMIFLNFLNTFIWLRDSEMVTSAVQACGVVMVATAGIWSAFQKNPRKILGYALILENGLALIAISLGNQEGLDYFAMALAPRMISIAILTLSIAYLQTKKTFTTFTDLRGILHSYPVVSGGLIISLFSFSGLPLLGFFPIRQRLLELLASNSLVSLAWVLAGLLGFILCSFRFLYFIVQTDNKEPVERGPLGLILVVGIGVVTLILIGLLPDLILSPLRYLLQPFDFLYPIQSALFTWMV